MNENGMIEEEDIFGNSEEDIFGNSVFSWYKNGRLHREDGPARIWNDGRKEWWKDGKPHREDGPAVIPSYGDERWYLNGNLLTKDQWWERLPDECKLKILFKAE